MQELLKSEIAQSQEIEVVGNKYRLAFPIGAVILYKKLTGDSLFNLKSWVKKVENGDGFDIMIGPDDDPEKFLFALYAGIYGGQLIGGYRGEPDPLILAGLKASVDRSNTNELFKALLESLFAYVLPKNVTDENPQTAKTVN